MSRKMGRPIEENPRNIRVEIKLKKDELEKLDYCCEITNKNRSEVIRDSLVDKYNKLKNQE